MQIKLSLIGLIALVFCLHAGALAEERLERVEPPFWWIGFEQQELALMLYGDGLGDFEPAVDYPGVTIKRTVRVASPNYLFVYLGIGEATRPGDFDIELNNGSETLGVPYTLYSRSDDPGHARGFSPADSIYLITPDRFANGDTRNDNVAGLGDPVDRDDPDGRHGGDIAGIVDHLDYIDDMGFTAIWLNPLLENAMPRTSYHGYATTDFYRVDARFGSNEDYRRLVSVAKARGIGTIMDMIVNHIGSEHWWMHDLPTGDWLNHQGEAVITTHERTTLQDAYAAEGDIRAFADGWFVDTMPDLNQRNPLLADYLVQNAIWWIEYLGLAGIRMDTWPYPDKAFMAEWTRRVMQEYPDFNIVGEEWSLNQPTVAYWQRGKANHDGYVSWLPSLMDFPLQDALRRALINDEERHQAGWIELYRTLSNDFLYADPGSLVIFPDNHDMSRIYTQLGEDFDLFRMAMVWTVTMRGAPQIYYGTEILMRNPGTDAHGVIRSDFPGGWRADERNAFTGRGLGEAEKAAQTMLRTLLNWRKESPVIHRGRLLHYVPVDGVYVYFRYDDNARVMVAMNKNDTEATLIAGRFAEGIGGRSAGIDVLTGRRHAVTDAISVPAGGTLLLELVD